MGRTTFIVDGFNLYHSVKQAAKDRGTGQSGTKWLDLRRLCADYLPLLGKSATLQDIYYFSALAAHLEPSKPGVTARHETYLRCLRDSGIQVEISRFKSKEWFCGKCRARNVRHEEKETDVALAAKLLELLALQQCETVVLVTGDTDIAPAIRTAGRLYPTARLCFAFPYGRKNKELAQLVKTSFRISGDAYVSHQFPDPVTLRDGTDVQKPTDW